MDKNLTFHKLVAYMIALMTGELMVLKPILVVMMMMMKLYDSRSLIQYVKSKP